jgi:hypothetical protein
MIESVRPSFFVCCASASGLKDISAVYRIRTLEGDNDVQQHQRGRAYCMAKLTGLQMPGFWSWNGRGRQLLLPDHLRLQLT